jgi:hypothetical protein
MKMDLSYKNIFKKNNATIYNLQSK